MSTQYSIGSEIGCPVIGNLSAEEAAKKLREIGHDITLPSVAAADTPWWKFWEIWWGSKEPKAWQHTAHAFGYIPEVKPEETSPVQLTSAISIKPSEELQGQSIIVTLDKLRVAEYPGDGIHHILFDFYAENHIGVDQVERLHFNQTYRAQEGQSVGAISYPIFVGLNVGSSGIAFKCYTVNVKNDNDEAILSVFDSDLFKSGLKLAKDIQPAIEPLSSMALGLTRAVASRNKNIAVQDFYMGLDFSSIATRAKLAIGSYIAVQIPETSTSSWNWSEWYLNPVSGQITRKNDSQGTEQIPYNYVIFSVSKYI